LVFFVRVIRVATRDGGYPVLVGESLERSGEAARSVNDGGRAVVVADSNVAPLYAGAVKSSLERAGYRAAVHVIAAGEHNKRLAAVEGMYEAFYRHGLDRTDLVAALGGGVTGDMAGFAAGTYLRGVACLQLPTTLLAQVDSSVGGKTGVDMPWGKNLVGVFHQPAAVVADPGTLNTLSPALVADGMAEAVKCGCIMDSTLFFDILNGRFDEDKTDMIAACIDIKRRVVEADERESGLRMILNFGHTLGHAIERAGGFARYSHGQAVAAGMVWAARLGERLGVTPPGVSGLIEQAVGRWGLPGQVSERGSALYDALTVDKKRDGDRIRLVLLKDIGEASVVPLPLAELREHLG